MIPDKEPIEPGMVVRHNEGLRYQVDDVRRSATGYETTHELGGLVVNYTQLEQGSFPPGTQWSKDEAGFRAHFTSEKLVRLTSFTLDGRPVAISYAETIPVKDGVVCDTYTIEGDTTRDLAIVRVDKGSKTPLQKVLRGSKTIEGFLEGKGILTVVLEDGTIQEHTFDSQDDVGKEVIVAVGETMQWAADEAAGLVFYEICEPPYEDGRYENLPE